MSKRKLIILDIDETLIFATEISLETKADFFCSPYFIYRRPHVDEFLMYCRKEYEVAIWTSASESYALDVIKSLFPINYPLAFIFTEDRCTKAFDHLTKSLRFIKDLKKVKRKGYSLQDVIVIENNPSNISRQYANVIPVISFIGDPSDNELLQLMTYLDYLKAVEDVRKIEKRDWKNRIV
ncbi:MAG: hypothetical protein A2Y62_09175 [Candidatus Fischerbacteria bacterium RBG_13_37_8]|uniref:FCP1 homology domain-containing protein n=1 Tax=Candidatus Fischerbacteria bacterium RBG_13_37_8 TaxID=1817863 RepID=A0A1F5VK69_9BACT|nr:MAG: hypothetical protein A2Y62_09175 [Candidatus Fischerbacteria bacterium RBG_13_37_8]